MDESCRDSGADSLAKLIFVEAPRDATLHLTLPCLSDTKQLFFLLLDLMIRGLLLMFARPGVDGREGIAIHTITPEQFEAVAARLAAAGILCHKEAVDTPLDQAASTNMRELVDADDNMPLDGYRLRVVTCGTTYFVWFGISRQISSESKRCQGRIQSR